MSRHSLLLSCAVCALSIVAAPAAFAQDDATQAQQTTPPPGDATTVDDVVVTAEGRQVSVQDVPVAISAFTAVQRDRIGILSIGDLTNFTPGFSYSASNDRPSIRGISRLTNNFAVDNGVATYSDGVWTNSTLAAASTPLMVNRTEILRGPQGTLYGRNSIGGAINVISRRPTEEMYAEVRATIGSYGLIQMGAAVSGPLTDWLRFRVLVTGANQREGYFTNVANGDTEGGRGNNLYIEGQLEFDITENFEGWLKVNTFRFDDYGRSSYTLGNYDTQQFTTGSLGPGNAFGFTQPTLVQLGTVTTNPTSQDHRLFNVNTPTYNTLRDNLGATLHLTYHASSFDVRYIGGYQIYSYVGTSDFDGTPVISYLFPGTNTTIFPSAIFDYREDREWWSNEISLVSTGDGPLQWIVGAFQYREDYEQPFFIHSAQPEVRNPYYTGFCGFYNNSFCTGAPTPVLAPPQPDGSVYLVNTLGDGESYAVYAQLDYDITQTFHVTAGLRHTWDSKHVLESERLICFGVVAFGCPPINGAIFGLNPAPVIAQDLTPATSVAAPGASAGVRDPATGQLRRTLQGEWSAFTGTLGLQWEPTDDTLAYFRYSRGYKAGGFNTGAAAPFAALPRVDEETVDAFEIGLKQEFGTFLTVNISAFFYDYQGAQAPFTVVPAVGPAFTQFINIPSSHNTGVEIETTWRPIHNLQILANYSYLSAEIQEGGGCYTDSLDPTASLPSAQPAGCVGGGQRIEGRQLPAVTPHKVALNANYTWDLDPGSVTASVSWIWKDRTPYSFFGNPNTYAPSYSQTDVRLSFNSRGGGYTITAYGRNIFDQEGYEGAGGTRQTLGNVVRNFTITPPRTYGVELQWRF